MSTDSLTEGAQRTRCDTTTTLLNGGQTPLAHLVAQLEAAQRRYAAALEALTRVEPAAQVPEVWCLVSARKIYNTPKGGAK